MTVVVRVPVTLIVTVVGEAVVTDTVVVVMISPNLVDDNTPTKAARTIMTASMTACNLVIALFRAPFLMFCSPQLLWNIMNINLVHGTNVRLLRTAAVRRESCRIAAGPNPSYPLKPQTS